jgi:hypothetical protein
MDGSGAVFVLDGDRALPTELARGPWSPDAQHGGAPAALLARAVEGFDPGPATFVARLTVELLRPVPLTPLRVRTATIRPGKKVQLVEARLLSDDVEVARATALRLRRATVDLPVVDAAPPGFPLPAESTRLPISPLDDGPGFWDAFELRFARGSWLETGAATVWFRLVVSIVAGEEPSPLQRVAAAADFGNGVSTVVEHGRYSFINPDLTVTLVRAPVGEWVALDAATLAGADGVGLAESGLYDEGGRIGRAVQCLLVDRL